MTVSVLLTSYNAGWLLRRAITSIQDQSYVDWELLILDDGSTDPVTQDILQVAPAYWNQDQISVRLCRPTTEDRQRTVRYATLLNWGAEHTTGEYLTFLCGDDYFMPDRLERMASKLQEGHDIVYGPQLLLDENGRQVGLREAEGVLTDAYHRVDLNSVMMTREAFNAVGGFTDRPATPQLWREADAWLWRKLTGAGYRFVPVDGNEPTDCKTYREQGVDARVIRGETPWLPA